MDDKPKQKLSEFEAQWRRFIDGLCVLIDSRPGGSTVSAIIVEDVQSHLCYWVTANNGLKPKAVNHLRWIMETLSRPKAAPLDRCKQIEDEITTASVRISPTKVENYRAQLSFRLRNVCDTTSPATKRQDACLQEAIDELNGIECHIELCDAAYNFRTTKTMALLNEKCKTDHAWRFVRHYIARLGWWRQAASEAVSFVTKYPQAVADFDIKPIPQSFYERFYPRPQVQTMAFEDALEDIILHFRTMLTNQQFEVLKITDELKRGSVTADFINRLTNIIDRAHLHAEVATAEFAHYANIKFFKDYKYIGCSKPSCYLCDKYLEFHPGNFVARPCHSNVWPNWLAPKPIAASGATALAHVNEILAQITQSISRDIQEQLVSKRAWTGRKPDSTTGTFTTLPSTVFQRHA